VIPVVERDVSLRIDGKQGPLWVVNQMRTDRLSAVAVAIPTKGKADRSKGTGGGEDRLVEIVVSNN